MSGPWWPGDGSLSNSPSPCVVCTLPLPPQMAQLLSKMQLTAAPTADGSGVTVHVPITRSDVLHGQECMCTPAGDPVVAAGTSSSCFPLCMPGTMWAASRERHNTPLVLTLSLRGPHIPLRV